MAFSLTLSPLRSALLIGVFSLPALMSSPVLAQATATETSDKVANGNSPIRITLHEVKTHAKVVEIDYNNRIAVLLTPKNDFVTIRAPQDVNNFGQIKVGDELNVRYGVAIAARLEHADKSGIRETIVTTSTTDNAAGQPSSSLAEHTVEVIAHIKAIHTQDRTVTLRGATRTITIAVPQDVPMNKIKVGDQVHAVFNDAFAIEIERLPAKESKKNAKK